MAPSLHWLLHTSLPLWIERGVDRRAGAFHEVLSRGDYICDVSFRRLRVAARQTYVFSRAHAAGVPGAAEVARLGTAFLLGPAALRGGGFAASFDLTGRATDTDRDIYDQAFVLLAFAAAVEILPPAPLRQAALALHAYIIEAFAHPAGGFAEALPGRLPRRQNPHMHLLEATLAAYRAFGDAAFLDTARLLVALALERFIHPPSGAMLEYYADDWAPHAVDGTHIVEPGHCCEWAWLLHEYQVVTGADAEIATAAAGLMAFVDRHGVHPVTGDLIDAVAPNGKKLALTSRLWPQTERLKAELVRPGGDGAAQALVQLENWLLPDGLWVERRGADGADLGGPAPASSLYHPTCALLLEPPALTTPPGIRTSKP
jgi:mannose/cellobiose epimerase-like protein (N-acyl-D-glucosamine 2-epimerase family)